MTAQYHIVREEMLQRKYITYLIILMGASMLGLVALQFYWLNTTIESNRETFVHEAHEALSSVVQRLEQQEAVDVLQRRVGEGVTIVGDSIIMDVDSAGNVRWQEEKRIVTRQLVGTKTLTAEGFAYEVEEETFIKKSGIARKNPISKFQAEQDIELMPEPLQLVDTSGSPAYQVMRKSDMVNSIVNELLNVSKGRALQDRINQESLDSLIGLEVESRGLDSHYYYGVKDMSNPNSDLLFCNDLTIQDEVVQQGYSVRLFPTDAFGNRNQLYVYFPDKEGFILHKMWGALLGSIIFLVMVIACFVLAITTIFRQKRISDITNDFISNLTHELKTPIATVSLTTEALMDPDVRAMPQLAGRYLQVIKEENERLGQQVEKVLQIARLDKGDFKLNIVEVDLHHIIEHAIKNIDIQIASRGGHLSVDLQAEDPVVLGDQVHLTNIIYNLLDNANKYSPEYPNISVHTQSSDKGITIQIADQGQGISKEMLNKVFDKFFRVPTGNVHDVKGFGLGLSYVKTMVDAHHGSISVKSELNKGTTFSIFLPYKQHEA